MVSIGKKLRDARVAKGISIEQMAEITKIPLQSIDSIENEMFFRLPHETIVKGFIKSICQVLNIDDRELLGKYESLCNHNRKTRRSVPLSINGSTIKPRQKYRFLVALLIFLIFGALLLFVIFAPSTVRGEGGMAIRPMETANAER